MEAGYVRQYARLRIASALDHLSRFRRLTISGALDYLSGLRFRFNIFHLYQHFFPEEYAHSEASSYPPPNSSGHSPRESEFFELVLSHLFPILDPGVLEDDEVRFDGIPIEVCGITYDDADHLDVCYRIVGAALGALGLDWDDVTGEWPVQLPEPLARRSGMMLDLERLEALCRKRGGMWTHVPIVARIACNETGNDFLDVTYETPLEWPPWTRENVEYLRQEWASADQMLSQAEKVTEWLKQAPRRMASVITLMNRATVDHEYPPAWFGEMAQPRSEDTREHDNVEVERVTPETTP
jgi:hypothetical protein